MGINDKAMMKVHERHISIATFFVDENTLAVQGSLLDERTTENYLISGERRGPGPIHHMVIRLLIGIKGMIIEDYELEMKTVPREICHETENFMEKIRGLSVSSGFSRKIRELLGHEKGCAHCTSLLLDMAPAIMQGLWTAKGIKRGDAEKNIIKASGSAMLQNTLKNTCFIWRENGPHYQKVKKQLEEMEEKQNFKHKQ